MQCRPPDRPNTQPTAAVRPRARRPARPPAALQTTTDDSKQNNTGPLGGPVITYIYARSSTSTSCCSMYKLTVLKYALTHYFATCCLWTRKTVFEKLSKWDRPPYRVWPWPMTLSIPSELWSWPTNKQKRHFKGPSVQRIEWKQTDGQRDGWTDGQMDDTNCSIPSKLTRFAESGIIIHANTSMSVNLIIGPNCTLAASHAALPGESRWVCAARPINVRKQTGQTGKWTPDRGITLTPSLH